MSAIVSNTSRAQAKLWWLYLLQGIPGIILGLVLISCPTATLSVLETVVGIYWFFIGTMALARVYVDRSAPRPWSLLAGVVGILAGLLVLRLPLFEALTVPITIVTILGVQGFILGALEITAGFSGDRTWSLFLGLINIAIAVLLLSTPLTAALAIPLVFGLLMLIQGAGFTVLALRARAA